MSFEARWKGEILLGLPSLTRWRVVWRIMRKGEVLLMVTARMKVHLEHECHEKRFFYQCSFESPESLESRIWTLAGYISVVASAFALQDHPNGPPLPSLMPLPSLNFSSMRPASAPKFSMPYNFTKQQLLHLFSSPVLYCIQ